MKLLMKNKSLYIIAFAITLLASCTDEDTPTPGGGTTDDRDRYLGDWICTESATLSFTINITKKGTSDTIRIENFGGYGPDEPQAIGLISGNSMTIPFQSITLTSINIQGYGVLNGASTKITMNYVADGNTIAATCTR